MYSKNPGATEELAKQKEYHDKQRGSWNGISPVTRTVPNGKAYNRNRSNHKEA